MSSIHQTVVWRCLFQPSMEHFALSQARDGRRLAGTVVAVADGDPLLVNYAVDCAVNWHTRHVEIVVSRAHEKRTLTLKSAGDGTWQVGDQLLDAVNGCVDVDLGITPATNTLPIRRLGLAVGESAGVTATWVRFPSLVIQPLSQRYTRVAERRYHYESHTGFECEIDVDEHGIVTYYSGGWETI